MFTIHRKEIEWAGKKLVIETGKIARQSDGAVMISYGDTTLLCTAVGSRKANNNLDFFPLSVHYQEKSYAVGKIPGGYIKREGRPSERAVLLSRLIDRPIRPLFPEEFKQEVQVICTLLSHDLQNDSDVIAIIGASAALAISGLPFLQTVAAAKVGCDDQGKLLLNPTIDEMENSSLELIVAGTKEGVLMVESEAKELSEEKMLEAVSFAHDSFAPVIEAIEDLAKLASKPSWVLEDNSAANEQVLQKISELAQDKIKLAYQEQDKTIRTELLNNIKTEAIEKLAVADDEIFTVSRIVGQFKKISKKIVRDDLLTTGNRIDGRKSDEIRPIACETSFLPMVHGSALFTRGETQSMVVVTLGSAADEQCVESLKKEVREKFLLHYNFPPFSVKEVGRMMGPGRREIGHGKLGWRSLNPVLPSRTEFPYTIRLVSEITESNGSSSMATVCGSSLAMMDAGIPIKSAVSGIAMGLIKEQDKFAIISDILGDEDHLGDMDFKVAGSEKGITALQMDIKITSITKEIMQQALQQAHKGRLHILKEMQKAIVEHKESISPNAPKMHIMAIDKEKIGDLIGPGGKNIKLICEKSNSRVNITEEGNVEIASDSETDSNIAISMINDVLFEPKTGDIINGVVSKVLDFGIVVNFAGNNSGLVHISQINGDKITNIAEVIELNAKAWVKITDVERNGKIKLTMIGINQDTGAEG